MNFRRNFDRCPFDELSFDENTTNGRVRRDVRFDGKSHSTKGLSTKSHGCHTICLKKYMQCQLFTSWYVHLNLSFALIGLLVLGVNKGPFIRLVNSPLLTC